jgi:hypothetical protein
VSVRIKVLTDKPIPIEACNWIRHAVDVVTDSGAIKKACIRSIAPDWVEFDIESYPGLRGIRSVVAVVRGGQGATRKRNPATTKDRSHSNSLRCHVIARGRRLAHNALPIPRA